jgi:Restriction endonuclease
MGAESSKPCPLCAVDSLRYAEKNHKEPKTPRKGRDLEILVANLEKHLGDTGIQVTSPDYIVGRRSGSRREVDVALRAKIGSSNLLVIVECRDRNETEDVTWVEQLASKREDVGADKAVAVSAVGFTEGAKNAAATYGIPLRTLQQVDLSEVLLWFPFQEMQLHKLCWTLHHTEIAVDQDALESLRSVADQSESPETLRAGDVPFRAKRDGSLAPIWQHLWNDLPGPRLYEEVPSHGTRIPYVVQLQFPNEQLRYQVQTAVGFIDVMEITLFADLWIERQLVPLAAVRSYDDEGHVLARDAQFHVEHEYAKLTVSFSQYPDKETQSVAVWGAGKPNISTFVEVDVSPPQSRAGTKVVRLTARGS